MSVLFVDVGDEEEAGPLRRFQNSRERCKFLAPSISVSVPEDDPYHSDEEYYEHPLFSPEWTHSGSRPTGQAVTFRQIEGEPRMVPLCHPPPLSIRISLTLSHSFQTDIRPSFFFCDLTFFLHPSLPSSFRLFVRRFVSLFVSLSANVFVCVLVMSVCSRSEKFHLSFSPFIAPQAIATGLPCYELRHIAVKSPKQQTLCDSLNGHNTSVVTSKAILSPRLTGSGLNSIHKQN